MVVALVIVAVAILLLAGAAAGHVNSPARGASKHRDISVPRSGTSQTSRPDIDIQVRLSPEGRRLAEKYIKKHHL